MAVVHNRQLLSRSHDMLYNIVVYNGQQGVRFFDRAHLLFFLEDLRSYFFFSFIQCDRPRISEKKVSEVFNYSYTHSWFVFCIEKLALIVVVMQQQKLFFSFLIPERSKGSFLGPSPNVYQYPPSVYSLVQKYASGVVQHYSNSLQISYQSSKKSYVHQHKFSFCSENLN